MSRVGPGICDFDRLPSESKQSRAVVCVVLTLLSIWT